MIIFLRKLILVIFKNKPHIHCRLKKRNLRFILLKINKISANAAWRATALPFLRRQSVPIPHLLKAWTTPFKCHSG